MLFAVDGVDMATLEDPADVGEKDSAEGLYLEGITRLQELLLDRVMIGSYTTAVCLEDDGFASGSTLIMAEEAIDDAVALGVTIQRQDRRDIILGRWVERRHPTYPSDCSSLRVGP